VFFVVFRAAAREASAVDVFKTYFEAWNAREPARTAERLALSVADDVRFVDPVADITGRNRLAAHIAEFRARYPDARIEHASAVDQHHDRARYAWVILSGATRFDGLDAVRLDAAGRLARIDGFFGPLRMISSD
jgi:hypothetical protein